jgi:DNA polymerase III epsilon subunit-like protein
MKLTYDLVVVDLETTAYQDEHGYQKNNYITEIGAVLLNKNLEIVDKFSTLVFSPEEITPEIEKLTGITNEMVKTAPDFPLAIRAFEDWIFEKNCRKLTNVRLCAWGTYFDARVFRAVCEKYRVPYNFSGSWYDIKSWAVMWHILSGKKSDKTSVENVCKLIGIEPTGSYHRALVDAIAEAKIVQHILKDLSSGFYFKTVDGRPYSRMNLKLD